MRIFISAGEASGDAYGAALKVALVNSIKDASFEGIGSHNMAQVNIDLIAKSSSWGAISIYESIKVSRQVTEGYLRARSRLYNGEPGIFVAIDFGFVNLRLMNHAKKAGWMCVYFIPPGSWKRNIAGKDVARLSDLVIVPFPWNVQPYQAIGTNVKFFGHPLKQLMSQEAKIIIREPYVAVFPGSRKHEISLNLPVIARSLPEDLPANVALTPSTDLIKFRSLWNELAPNRKSDQFFIGQSRQVLQSAKAAIIVSGTATLEAALCKCPMIVIYRLSKMAKFEARCLGFKLETSISLPNIILNEPIIPEFLQDDVTPENCRLGLDQVLNSSAAREKQMNAFSKIDQILGPENAINQAAGAIAESFL